ncbi:MAG: sigma-70 family RNA polymerase sigma factor [Actinobacteria bacterium]|nr:MAG: sigma-70 family RNA polymerase sigma factor [Actinomycetota bacterium]
MSASEGLPRADSLVLDAEKLFQTYSAPVYRYCLARLDSPQEAEDAVQATFLNAWRSLQCGTFPNEPRSWLFSIAANVCATILRTQLRGAKVEVRAPEHFERLPGDEVRGDELVELEAALKTLPARQRQALLLRDWRGCSYTEIATELSVSQPAVETLLFRARRALVASLEQPAQRIRQVPLRSTLSALLPWPSVLLRFKSSLATSATTKIALGTTIGVTAPLIVFSVLPGTFGSQGASRDQAAGVEFRFDARNEARTALWPRSAEPAPARPTPKRLKPGAGTRKRRAALAPGSEPNGAGGEITLSQPTSSTEPSQLPPATSEPPAKTSAGNELVVICHMTGSKHNPAVTISVNAAAVNAHLAHGDALGACAR